MSGIFDLYEKSSIKGQLPVDPNKDKTPIDDAKINEKTLEKARRGLKNFAKYSETIVK